MNRAGGFFSTLMVPLRIAVPALALLLAGSLPTFAQGEGDDVFLDPIYLLPQFAGPDFGYTLWKNEASFSVTDQAIACATFTDNEGKGPTMGAKAFFYFNPWLFVSPRIRYETRSSTFLTNLPDEPVNDASNSETVLRQEAQVDMAASSITLDLRAGIDIAEIGLYVAIGGGINMMTEGTYNYTERILAPSGFIYSDTRSAEHMILKEKEFESYESIAIDARAGLGYLLQFGKLAFNPEVFYILPLTSSLAAPDKLKQTGMSGSLGILYNFGE